MSFDLCTAGVDDVDLLLDLMRGLYASEHMPFDPERARRAVLELLAAPSLGEIHLIQTDGKAIGYAVLTLGYSLEFAGRYALLDELFIREDFRGKGAGRQILEHLGPHCHAMGVQALRLEVERKNRGARELYARLGFEAHDRDLMTLWIRSTER